MAIDLLFLFCFRTKTKVIIVLEDMTLGRMDSEVDLGAVEVVGVVGVILEVILEVGAAVSEVAGVTEMIETNIIATATEVVAAGVVEVVLGMVVAVVGAVAAVSTIGDPGGMMTITTGVRENHGVTKKEAVGEVAAVLGAAEVASIKESPLKMEIHKIKRLYLMIDET